MKHIRLITVLTLLLFLFMALAGCTGGEVTPSAEPQASDDGTFNPDYADGIKFGQMRDDFGDIPKIEGSLKLGCVAKAFETSIGGR